MRIATVCFSGTLGGLELATLRRGAELLAHGHHVVAVLPDAPALHRHAHSLGLNAHIVQPSLKYLDLSAALKLRRILRSERIEAMIVGRTHDLSTATLAAGNHVAVVLYQQMQSGIRKRDWFHNRIYRRLDGAVAITRAVGEQLARYTILDADRISVVSYGIDAAEFSPDVCTREEALARFDLPSDAFVVGIVGGFNPGKGQREFIEGIALAAAEDHRLALCLRALVVGERPGDEGEYPAALRRLRDSTALRDRIHFHPFQDDPRVVYRSLDVFVLASHSETFGMVLQEALAMGTASIGTASGGVPEIITDGWNGLLVPPHDPRAIADAILRFYREPELRAACSRNGRSFALQAYNPARQYALFEKAVTAAIGRRCEQQGKPGA